MIAVYEDGGVAPFGNPRIKACLLLPEAYRSLPRPSSPTGAKASIVRPYTLNRRKTIVLGLRCNSQTMQLSKNHSAIKADPCSRRPCLRNCLDPERHTRYRITLVGVPGIEPGTSSLSGMRSNQLSYTPDTVPFMLPGTTSVRQAMGLTNSNP